MHRDLAYSASEAILDAYPERANLYKLTLEPVPATLYHVRETVGEAAHEKVYFFHVSGATVRTPSVSDVRRAIQSTLMAALGRAGYKVRDKFPLIVDTARNFAPAGTSLQIYTAFDQTVMYFGGTYYLCLDHHLVVRAALSLSSLTAIDETLQLPAAQRVLFRSNGEWNEDRWIGSDGGDGRLTLNTGDAVVVAHKDIFPALTRPQVTRLAPILGVDAQHLERTIKQLSYLTTANAPRARLDACTQFAARLARDVFPVVTQGTTLHLDPTPAVLRPPDFVSGQDLHEVEVAFDHADRSKRARDILVGLTSFGTYDKPAAPLRVVVISTHARSAVMERLIERLNKGSGRYAGARKTFGGEIVIGGNLVCTGIDDYEGAIRQFVRGPHLAGMDVALVYLPKTGDISDPDHPYFRVKGLLAREGLASQMVDEATVQNPIWRDLNLALDIYTKAGYVPWVLDEAVPGVDLFIGLSSSWVHSGDRIDRAMGYANVFDAYGRWRFYQGDSAAFPFEKRLEHYGDVVRDSVAAYRAEGGGTLNAVHIHLTKRFNAQERDVLAQAVRAQAPGATVVFVWVNAQHRLRLYDLSVGGDGQIGRATYLRDDPGRIYLATTGSNMFNQQVMGTAVPLQLTVWTDPVDAPISLRDVGQQVLSLTRLNWASSRNFCREPITTKFAGDIARLMTAFMRDPGFVVNSRLRRKPWFL